MKVTAAFARIDVPRTPSMRLDGRRALVTGGSRGIGFACAAALAQAGASVTLAARSETELDAACSAIRESGGDCTPLVLDVTNAGEVVERIAGNDPFQILVNSAGINRPRTLIDMDDEDIEAILDLNVIATMRVTREVARALIPTGQPGSIINVSSQMGLVGSPRRTAYCASKHAVEGFSKALAWELGPQGVRVNTICPTFIETSLTAGMFVDPGFRQWVTERIALGRVGRIDEVMGAVVFLASDASSLMTGSALVLDGGWTAA
jgi:NAD(P)-dependent dehydrogenase (short-subunit alcohol dehydrogenase family)